MGNFHAMEQCTYGNACILLKIVERNDGEVLFVRVPLHDRNFRICKAQDERIGGLTLQSHDAQTLYVAEEGRFKAQVQPGVFRGGQDSSRENAILWKKRNESTNWR